ncbi:MAG: tRNA (N(6)-L-threonylcarbamoyladenosine(37)-C(2))-methylthiotransferase MtaB [Lachnospiraceae bacterium]|nr:tRNA (N(6)-L-threonylcarbamoyladenosine(37)-C(2))-methylthiotransferase MtaB [Lachnospiraceae bacterium]
MAKKAALHNLGCKVNAYETESMQQMLEQAGYEIVPFAPGADIYIINTCSVTNIADRKSRQMLHKAKKMNPEAIVVAAGCYVESEKHTGGKVDDAIDIVIGNNCKKDLVEILEAYEEGKRSEAVIDINHTKEYEELNLNKTAEHTRAYVKVQDGCNQFCSYCIIPYTRGRVRSRKSQDVYEEIVRLANAGYHEVVLTGIHLSSYGVDLEEENLLTLIEKIHEIEGIERIRLGSLEPRIMTEEFVAAIANLPKLCPHFHLSLQSGCDETLKRMNRRYTAEEYYEVCKRLRKYFENPALTTDVIVGFAGETEEEFAECKAFLEKIEFFETHIFKFSIRKGTRAAKMENQVPDQTKTKRSNELLALNEKNSVKYLQQHFEKDLEVLMEEDMEINGVHYFVGHTKEYIRVAVKTEKDLTNQFVTVKAKEILKDLILLGE